MKAVSYLLIFLIPALIILLSIRMVAFDKDFYNKEFSKLGVYDKFENNTVNQNVDELMNYLAGKGQLQPGFFNDKELSHMKDVSKLFSNGYIVLYLLAVTFIILVVYMFMKKEYGMLGKAIIYGSLIGLGVILTGLLIVSLDFQGFFTNFHLISFNNELWLLNPETDNLIALFPEKFFFDATVRIIYIAIFIALASIALGLILLKYSRKH